MKTVLWLFLATLIVSTAVWADEFYADGPNGDRLYELKTQMNVLKAEDQYDDAMWTEFHDLIGNDNGGERGDGLDQGGDTYAAATVISGLPYNGTGTTCGYENDYNPECDGTYSRGKDVVYSFTPDHDIYVDISLCDPYTNFDTKLYVIRALDDQRIACDDDGCPGSLASILEGVLLYAGQTYYVVVDGYGRYTCGDYRLQINATSYTCNRLTDGVTENGDGTFTYRQTTDASSDSPYYDGPFYRQSTCGVGDWAGFGFYSAHDQDYGWKHNWSDWNTPGLTIQSVQVIICAWDIDEYTCNINNPDHPERCELDHIFADSALQNPEWLSGDNNIWSSTTFDIAPGALLDDGWLQMWIDINVWGSQCWSTTLSWSQLIVTYSYEQEENDPPYTPEGYAYPECADESTDQCVVVTGPNPADPDGDVVSYQYRWFVKNAGTGGGFVNDESNPLFPFDHTGSCVPFDHSFAGDQWRVQVYAVDEHGAQSLVPWIVDFPVVIVDCGEPWPFDLVDMGDLNACNYPTLVNNPGHGISGIAWLGSNVSGELAPNPVELDAFDDGVAPFGTYWTPCREESVLVVVTAGPNYGAYLQDQGELYLNAWKDGNVDGDFCDRIICEPGAAPADEWIIHDELVTPGSLVFHFIDPGVMENQGRYDAVMRFRLTSVPVGRNGAGLIDTVACPDMMCGAFAMDFLGEVEDHIFTDLQLYVEFNGLDISSDNGVITLHWTTQSERGNDHFEIIRDGATVGQVHGSGDSPTGHSYSWTDNDVVSGVTYDYDLVGVDVNGNRTTLAHVSAAPSDHVSNVNEYALHQNYPNPFNPATTIAFDLKEAGLVSLKVYNLQGQEVAILANGTMAQGAHNVAFDASKLPSGVYWYKLEVNGFSAARKMLLTK